MGFFPVLFYDSSVLIDLQRVMPQSPPPPPKPPSPSFELGLSSFPPLPGAASQLKTDDAVDNRLAGGGIIGITKEQVKTDANTILVFSK